MRAARAPRADARHVRDHRRARGGRLHARRPRGQQRGGRRGVPDHGPASGRRDRALPELRPLRGRHRRPHGARAKRRHRGARGNRPVAQAARADPAARDHRDLRHALLPGLSRRAGARARRGAALARHPADRHGGRAGRRARGRAKRDRGGVGRDRRGQLRDERRVVDDGRRVRGGRGRAPDGGRPRRARGGGSGQRGAGGARGRRERRVRVDAPEARGLAPAALPVRRPRACVDVAVPVRPSDAADPHRRPARRHAARAGRERVPTGDRHDPGRRSDARPLLRGRRGRSDRPAAAGLCGGTG